MKNVGLITGASNGIGRELALIHASKGRDVVLVARSEDKLNELKQEIIERYGVNARVYPLDLTLADAPKTLYDALKKEGIEVDYLFNNAGIGGFGVFHEQPLQMYMDMIQLNIAALTSLTHLFLPDMIARKNGRILMTASTAGLIPGPLHAVYYATKAYVVSFSRALNFELRKKNVTVTALCPGPVDSGFQNGAGMNKSTLFKNAKTATYTAQKGYKAMEKGKQLIVSGGFMKVAFRVLFPIAVMPLKLAIIEHLHKKQ
jgi:short-subunit dehydrogenase